MCSSDLGARSIQCTGDASATPLPDNSTGRLLDDLAPGTYACTVVIDGYAARSCSVPVSALAGKAVTTIEGLPGDATHPLQVAWIEHDVPQCGYCQSGQIMAAVALLKRSPKPTDAEINAEMSNICRCGTYPRIRAAIHRAAELQA